MNMKTKTIKARFFDSCMIIKDSRVLVSNISYDMALDMVTNNDVCQGGTIYQEFIDVDGYKGHVIRPYNMAG